MTTADELQQMIADAVNTAVNAALARQKAGRPTQDWDATFTEMVTEDIDATLARAAQGIPDQPAQPAVQPVAQQDETQGQGQGQGAGEGQGQGQGQGNAEELSWGDRFAQMIHDDLGGDAA